MSDGGDVDVRLRLPTPQCAPNFAYLMAADARAAVRRRAGGARGRASCSRTTTRATRSTPRSARGGDFADAVPGETEGELDALRELFQRKALVARQARVCQALLADGATPEAVAALRVGDLPHGAEARRCVELRGELGLRCGPDDAGARRRRRQPAERRRNCHVAAPRAAGQPEPGDQRRAVPLAAARPLRRPDQEEVAA